MFPKTCTYDHTFAIFVKIAATVFWKRYKLGADGSHMSGKTEHTAMVMSRQDQVCTPAEIGSAIFWVMGKKNIYGFRIWLSHKLFHFFRSELRGKGL